MIVFPNSKINLGLRIVKKRPDGYHDLQTVFYPIPFYDVLEFVPADSFSFACSGLPIEGNSNSNLVVKAYEQLKNRFPKLAPLKIHLHKQVPMGAGLGGGSSDGAHCLKALNSFFNIGLRTEDLMDLALGLGSDCPFFIVNQPVFAQGRGELMEKISLDLSGFYLALVNPGIHVSTKEAFDGISPEQPRESLKEQIIEPIENWRHLIKNDFEETVGKKYPLILEIKQKLYNSGAAYASMSGSGSVIYGIFRQKPELDLSYSNWVMQL